MTVCEHFNNLVGEEYKPYDLLLDIDNISELISSGKTGWEKK